MIEKVVIAGVAEQEEEAGEGASEALPVASARDGLAPAVAQGVAPGEADA